MKPSLSEYKQLVLSGKELITRFNDFLVLLNEEFHDPKISEKLQALAQNGLKIATGKNFEGWAALCAAMLTRFDAVQNTSEKEEIEKLVNDMKTDLMSCKRFQAYLQQAPREAKQFFQDQETVSDTDELLVNTGEPIVNELVNWVNELYNSSETG